MASDKYWMFDGKDAQGPYYADELKRQPGFGPETLICPDGTESPDQWRPARFYLIKPPGPSRPEPARPPIEVKPEPVPAELPSVAPQPALTARATTPAAITPKQLLSIVVAALTLASAGAYLGLRKKPKAAAAPSANLAASAAPAPAAEPIAEQVNQDAVDFVMKFPVQSAGPKLPPSPADIFSASRWKAPASVAEGLEMKSYYALGQSAGQTLQKQGHSPEAGAKELRRHGEKWDAYAKRFLKANYRLGWSTQFEGGQKYRVTAELRYHRDGPKETHAFEADLDRRTLRPLDLDAWYDVDPKGCARWGDQNLQLGEPLDQAAMTAGAPAYPYPLPHRGTHKKYPAEPPVAAAKKSRPAKSAPKVDLPPPEDAEYPDEAAAGEEKPSEAKKDDPWSDEPQSNKPKPKLQTEPGPRPVAKMPGTDQAAPKSAPQAPAPKTASNGGNPPPPDSSVKSKNATDMSVDELEKYLNRGASKN